MNHDWDQLKIPPRRPRPEESSSALGQLLQSVVGPALEQQCRRRDPLETAWQTVVPAGLRQQCCIRSFQRGTLTVAVSSPAFMYEFQLCRQALLDELKRQCPQAGLKNIKAVLG